jgi:import inner membrane translocase subunit TIM44
MQRLSPGAPLRASGLRSSRCTPPSQYRFLSARTTQRGLSENATYSVSTSLHQQPLLRSALPPSAIRLDRLSQNSARAFHVSARTQQKEAEEKTKTPPETQAGEEAKETSKEESKEESKEQAKEEKEGDEKAEGKEKEKKEDAPPPPPHGDKTPWQVFLDTMQTELKESKEWNESTKALASSANDFVESEKVRKARQAYEATSGAVSSTAAKAVKSTAGAIGKGATWTWDTSVMKGVRKGANKTGEVLDKATKPIRDTEAYKNVKDVIDDGSSSRYGGWVDKEERKRRRELREEMDKKNGVTNAIFDEDPE